MSKLEFRPLRADEIDVRVGSVSAKGVTLLLYKDSRADQNLLDETVGPMNWQRRHCRDNANCIVSIWDDDKKQWIEKEDTGTESYTESEKGLASDSFKRACFNWGIGRELYTAPFTFVKCETVPNGKGYKLKNPYEFSETFVSEIEYRDRKISKLTICNKGGEKIFTFDEKGKSVKSEKKSAEELTKMKPTDKITAGGVDYIRNLIYDKGADMVTILDYYHVTKLEDLTVENFEQIRRVLNNEERKGKDKGDGTK